MLGVYSVCYSAGTMQGLACQQRVNRLAAKMVTLRPQNPESDITSLRPSLIEETMHRAGLDSSTDTVKFICGANLSNRGVLWFTGSLRCYRYVTGK